MASRVAGEKDVQVSLRLNKSLVQAVDTVAKNTKRNRSDVLRLMVNLGLVAWSSGVDDKASDDMEKTLREAIRKFQAGWSPRSVVWVAMK